MASDYSFAGPGPVLWGTSMFYISLFPPNSPGILHPILRREGAVRLTELVCGYTSPHRQGWKLVPLCLDYSGKNNLGCVKQLVLLCARQVSLLFPGKNGGVCP